MAKLPRTKAIQETYSCWKYLSTLDSPTLVDKAEWEYSPGLTGRGLGRCSLCEYAEDRCDSLTTLCEYCPFYQVFGKNCMKYTGPEGVSLYHLSPEWPVETRRHTVSTALSRIQKIAKKYRVNLDR